MLFDHLDDLYIDENKDLLLFWLTDLVFSEKTLIHDALH